MRRFYTIIFCAILSSISAFAQRTGQMMIQGVMCSYDTVVHRTIAPGAKLTQYQFNQVSVDGTNYKMKAHVITIDVTNPYNSFSPYRAKGGYYQTNHQVQEVKRQKALGLKAVASMTGSGFVQKNTVTSTSTAYEVCGSLMTNGEVGYESLSNLNCYWDSDKLTHVGYVKLNGTAIGNGTSMQIGQVNHHRDLVDSQELISLFCNGIPSSVASDDTKANGTDLRVKINDGTQVKSGIATKCTVVEVLDGCNHTVNTGEAILSGIGKAADFLKTFKAGDEITLSLDYVNSNNEKIDVQNQISNLFNYCLKDGEVYQSSFLDNHYDSYNYAVCVIGNSKDNKTAYWAQLEISTNSTAPCVCLADLLKNIGVYDAIWIDGGPSAEMSVDEKWISVNSIGTGFNGRYIPAGLMLYSTAPDDNTLTSVEIVDPTPRSVMRGTSIDLAMYGYNQYGEMIQENAQTNTNVEITCTEGIGTINFGTFTATNIGTGYIYVKIKGSDETITIPVEVTSDRKITVYPKTLFTGEGRQCQLGLTYRENGVITIVDPKDATWTKSGRYVIADCANGLITPGIDGIANVYVSYDGLCDTATVTVENLPESGMTKVDFTDKIQNLSKINLQLMSVPRYFVVDVTGQPRSQVTLYYTLGTGDELSYQGDIDNDGHLTIKIDLDYDDVETYPVTIKQLIGSVFFPTTPYKINNLTAYYTLYGDVNNDGVVDISDVNAIITVICGGTIEGGSADINLDGVVDISDVNAVIRVICGN